MSKFCICYISDYNYSKHLLVSIKSLRETNKKIPIYIFHLNFPKKLIYKLQNSDLNLRLIKIDINKLKLIKSRNKIFFYRFFCPKILKSFKKILYIDLDTVIVGNLNSVFNYDLKNYPMGAVREPIFPAKPEYHYMKKTKKRFNTGVILFNVKKWNRDNLTQKMIKLSRDKKFYKTTDQPVANQLMYGKIKLINKKWNYLDSYELKNIKKAKIIHFNRHKPWLPDHKNRYEYLYYKYSSQPKYSFHGKTLNFKKILKKIKEKFK
tara:strand:- start:145 stop:936 length:792 start_codon:yes stop_codon:yes gene_type:complete